MIKLYGIPISNNVAKVRYCLNYLNLDYELIETSPLKGENQTDEFKAINPTGKVPAIDLDGFTLFESNTINRYLATVQNSPTYPTDARQRALVDAWSDFISIHVAHAMGRVGFNRLLAPVLGAEVDEKSIQTGLDFLAKYFPVLEEQLSKNKHIAGDKITLADIALLATLDQAELCQIDLSAYPNLTKWRNNLKAQAFYQKCYQDYTMFAQETMAAMSAS